VLYIENSKDFKTIFTYLPSLKEGDKIIWQLGVIGGELGVTVKLNKK